VHHRHTLQTDAPFKDRVGAGLGNMGGQKTLQLRMGSAKNPCVPAVHYKKTGSGTMERNTFQKVPNSPDIETTRMSSRVESTTADVTAQQSILDIKSTGCIRFKNEEDTIPQGEPNAPLVKGTVE